MGTQLPLEGTPPPNFRPMSIVAKQSPISATAELLLACAIGRVNRVAVLSRDKIDVSRKE